jgi:hypothetical protein
VRVCIPITLGCGSTSITNIVTAFDETEGWDEAFPCAHFIIYFEITAKYGSRTTGCVKIKFIIR